MHRGILINDEFELCQTKGRRSGCFDPQVKIRFDSKMKATAFAQNALRNVLSLIASSIQGSHDK